MSKPSTDYIRLQDLEPHVVRRKLILAAHPEVKKLFGNNPSSALYIFAIVGAQIGAAILLRGQSFWVILLAAFTFGAVASHALWVMIHEATHNLVFKSSTANRWIALVANLPMLFPAAISFRNYHLLHHRYQGELELDADLAGPNEARIMGKNALTKAVWLFAFVFFEGVIRPARLKTVKLLDRWVVFNTLWMIAFIALMAVTGGKTPLLYLLLSSMFAVGLHPVGARWIQEHYVVKPNQETYSYYGPFNPLMFNVGYHNEHHDLMMVPWTKLPALKAAAPEFYDGLYAHTSYTKLLLQFIFDPKLNLFSRVVRPGRAARQAEEVQSAADADLAARTAHETLI